MCASMLYLYMYYIFEFMPNPMWHIHYHQFCEFTNVMSSVRCCWALWNISTYLGTCMVLEENAEGESKESPSI
jgi:hypothetical protein